LRAESFKAAAELSAVGLPSSRCEVCDKIKILFISQLTALNNFSTGLEPAARFL